MTAPTFEECMERALAEYARSWFENHADDAAELAQLSEVA